MMRTTLLTLSVFVTVAVAGPPFQIQSEAPAWFNAGKQGCISVASNANGAPVVIHDCNNEDVANHSWFFSLFTRQNAGPQTVKLFNTNKCLDVVDGANFDGAKLQIWDCIDGNTNQLWTYRTDSSLEWSGTGKCVDLPDGSAIDGTPLQLWTCADRNSNQAWSGENIPNTEGTGQTLSQATSGIDDPRMCIIAESNTDGSPVSLAPCDTFAQTFPSGNATWIIPVNPLGGPVKTFGGSKCLDVPNGSDVNGTPLQIWSCVEGSTNQQWNRNFPAFSLSWVGKNKCVDLTNGNKSTGNRLQIWDCDSSNTNQQWF